MAPRKHKAPKAHNGRKAVKINAGRLAIYAIIAIVIIAILAYAFTYKGIQDIGTGGNVTVSQSGTIFILSGSEYSAYISNPNTLYISKQPAFLNPVMQISLPSNKATVHVNYGTQYSNIGVELMSSHNGSDTIYFSDISQSLAVSPDTGAIKIINSSVSVASTTTISPSPITTNTTHTTKSTTSSTVTTTTAPPNGYTNALTILKKSKYYSILQNYSMLYQNTSQCTPSLYNKTYENNYVTPPTGQNTYANVSAFVPYNMTYSVNSIGGNIYLVNYTAYSHTTLTTGTAFKMQINASDGAISNPTFSGVFQGLNTSALYQGYMSAARIGGACGIYMPSS